MSEEPKIIGIFCNWCSYEAADSAGSQKMSYPTNISIIRVMCSSRINPEFVLEAFKKGAGGVLIAGCHPGECHYQDSNYNTKKRVLLLKKLMKQLGINEKRLRLEWISAAEGDKLVHVIKEFVEELKQAGELNV